ncbi:protein EDS1L [Cajanus cajan]|nr:protein EDS1L [Cajanus cajan]
MMRREFIEKACVVSLKAHKSPDKPYLVEKISRSEVIICFPGSDAVRDWYSQTNFGQTKINLDLFPPLRSIGNDEPALVNEAFLKRFQAILLKPALPAEVKKALSKNKQIVFAGHSSGAPVAILATLWALENYQTPKNQFGIPPKCVTFGSPLVGNHIFSHATRRENWSHYFFHYVMRYDIVPRILLAPKSNSLISEPISQSFNPKSKDFMSESVGRTNAKATSDFYVAIMSNAATVTNYAASKLMGSTDTTLQTLANFIPLSPYRPFGTYIFCTGNGKLGKQIVINNPEAVLQVLFFSAQLSTEETEAAQIPFRSLRDHAIYSTELQQMGTQSVVNLDQLDKIPLSEDAAGGSVSTFNVALNDLGLSPRARLCLRAAAELEARRCDNENKLNQKKGFVEEKMKELQKYRELWEHQKKGFYDGFREHKKAEDFKANVTRLDLASVFDEMIEKLRSYELPDEFEGKKEWIDLGTRFRQLVEPLDVANYYRHARHYEDDHSSYMVKGGRPSRYRYPQRWLEHAERRPHQVISESCFWGEVEEIGYKTSNGNGSFEDVKERVERLETQIKGWSVTGVLAKDVLLEGSTFVKWWKALPQHHKEQSCIRNLI